MAEWLLLFSVIWQSRVLISLLLLTGFIFRLEFNPEFNSRPRVQLPIVVVVAVAIFVLILIFPFHIISITLNYFNGVFVS